MLCAAQGRDDEAESLHRQALEIREKVLGPNAPEIARSLFELGNLCQAHGELSDAAQLLQRAVDIQEKAPKPDDSFLALCLNALGVVRFRLAHFTESEALHRRALTLQEKALGPDHPDTGITRSNLALAAGELGRYPEAEQLFLRVLKDQEQTLGPDHPDVAQIFIDLADLATEQGRLPEAEKLFRRALAIREAALGPDHPDVADALRFVATILTDRGEYDKAEHLLQRAEQILAKGKDPNQTKKAFLLSCQAELSRKQGKYAVAESLFTQALKIQYKIMGKDHPDLAITLNNLANLHVKMGKTDTAMQMYTKSLRIIEKVFGPAHSRTASALTSLASLHQMLGHLSEAEELYRRSSEILLQASDVTKTDIAVILNNLSLLYRSQGNVRGAKLLLKKALAIYEKNLGPEHPEMATGLLNLAQLFIDEGNGSQAEWLLENAHRILEKNHGPEHPDIALVLSTRGRLYAWQDNWKQAFPLMKQAFDILERASGHAGGEAFSEKLRQDQQILCRDILDILFHYREQAASEAIPLLPSGFQIMELARSRIFLDQLLSRASGVLSTLSPEDRQREEELSAKANLIEEQRRSEMNGPTSGWNQERLSALEREASEVRAERKRFEDKLRKTSPRYLELRNPAPITVEQVQREILTDGEAIISYWQGDERLFACIIDPHTFHLVSTPVGSGTLNLEIRKFRKALGQPGDVSIYRQTAHTLYKHLFEPFAPYLPASVTRTVFIVPHGQMQTVPFEALVSSNSSDSYEHLSYLFDKYTFSYIPSVMAFRSIRNDETVRAIAALGNAPGFSASGTTSGPAPDVRDPAALFGDPVFSPAQIAASGTQTPAGQPQTPLDPLPGTRDEIETVADMLASTGNNNIHRYTGLEAQETRLKNISRDGTLARCRFIHFATHGLLPRDMAGVSEPCLVLSLVGDPENDGYVKMSEIFGLRLRADLVTLSACKTGLEEDPAKSQGLSGLARAFFYAGTPRLLVSLWSISDEGTSEFMKRFYAVVSRGGTSFAEALNRTRRELLSSKRFSHPFFWAPFILLGER